MKKCPSCSNTPITFKEWNKGLNAFSWKCRACSIPLKGNTLNFVLFGVTVISALVSAFIAYKVFDITFERKGIFLLLAMGAPILFGSAIGYQLGGYRDAKKNV